MFSTCHKHGYQLAENLIQEEIIIFVTYSHHWNFARFCLDWHHHKHCWVLIIIILLTDLNTKIKMIYLYIIINILDALAQSPQHCSSLKR